MDPNTPATPPPPPPLAPPQQPPPVMPAALVQPMIVERKSPGLAGFLSMFPGLGHLYLGLYQRAFAFAGAFCILIFFNSHGRIAGLSGPATAFLWFFAIIDAVRQAKAINRGFVSESGFATETQIRKASEGTGSLTWGVILVGLGSLWIIDRYVDIDWSFMEEWGGPAALILLGLVLVISHIRRKRIEHASRIGMPPRGNWGTESRKTGNGKRETTPKRAPSFSVFRFPALAPLEILLQVLLGHREDHGPPVGAGEAVRCLRPVREQAPDLFRREVIADRDGGTAGQAGRQTVAPARGFPRARLGQGGQGLVQHVVRVPGGGLRRERSDRVRTARHRPPLQARRP